MARQISTTCNFIMGYIKCELPEDALDVMVMVRMLWDTHTLKED